MSAGLGGPEREVEEELRHHLLELVDLLIAEGWAPDDARREAERRFGNVERIRGEVTRVRRDGGLPLLRAGLRSLAADLRYAARGLRNHPSFSVAGIATLALGLGAATMVFAVVDALMLRSLAYPEADRWVEVRQSAADRGSRNGIPAERLPEWNRISQDLFDGQVAFVSGQLVRTDGENPESLSTLAVSGSAPELLGIPIRLGRGFSDEDTRPGAATVALLTEGYWERSGADPGVVGRTLRTEVGPMVVVGVLGEGPRFPTYGGPRDMWVPLRDDLGWADRPSQPNARPQGLWARLRPGLDQDAAEARIDAASDVLAPRSASGGAEWRVTLRPLAPYRGNPPVRRALWTLAATVAALLLIALVNVVNLALARASARGQEVAVRVAIGGSRSRLLRQFLVEGALLGLLGGAVGLALAWAGLEAIRGMLPLEVTFFSAHAIEVEFRTLATAGLASLAAGIALGLVPAAFALSGRRPFVALGSRADDRASLRRLRGGLVVAQVALTTTLLVVAGLLGRSMTRLLAVDPGFDADRIAVADLAPSPTRYPDDAARAAFVRRLEEALEARPELEGVTVTTGTGFAGGGDLETEGSGPPASPPPIVPLTSVAPDWFETVGTEVVVGRSLVAEDAAAGNVVIDLDLARLLWNADAPLGQRFRLGGNDNWMAVVGVVRELRLMGRDQRQGPGQILRARDPDGVGDFVSVVMRTQGDPRALLPIFRETLRSLDPEQWVWRLRTGRDALAAEEDIPRFLLRLMAALAVVAALLSAVGLYGVLAFAVGRRQRELGLRMALGAGAGRVRRAVLGQGLALVVGGVVLGGGGAIALSPSVSGILYETPALDPVVYGSTVLLLVVIGCAAAWLPAFRATRVDPVTVLRAD